MVTQYRSSHGKTNGQCQSLICLQNLQCYHQKPLSHDFISLLWCIYAFSKAINTYTSESSIEWTNFWRRTQLNHNWQKWIQNTIPWYRWKWCQRNAEYKGTWVDDTSFSSDHAFPVKIYWDEWGELEVKYMGEENVQHRPQTAWPTGRRKNLLITSRQPHARHHSDKARSKLTVFWLTLEFILGLFWVPQWNPILVKCVLEAQMVCFRHVWLMKVKI